ncbi:MAG: PHP domain-containing protein, partial [Candidatus Sumerlaeia bacterium]|nr:PHP domain-containing protein [Candidatus Sumerlaeia bacterium]
MSSFVHLHTHSYYSYDGVATIEQLVAKAAELKMPAIALTDHNSIAGIEELYNFCEIKNIRPIIGVELEVKPLCHRDKKKFSLILLAEQEIGYRNLCRLLSCDEVGKNELAEYNAGLIVLTGGVKSELWALINDADESYSLDYIKELLAIYGKDNLVIELQAGGNQEQQLYNQQLIQLAIRQKILPIATCNVHYLKPEDRLCHSFLAGEEVETQLLLGELVKNYREREYLHFATSQEISGVFSGFPKAIENTYLIAERCNVKLADLRRQPRYYSYERGRDPESFLWDLISQRVSKYYSPVTAEIKERINEEFNYYTKEGLAEFLIFHYKLKSWLQEQGIVSTIRRGYILSSLMAYILGITEIDPIKFRLRFDGIKEKKEQIPEIILEISSTDRERIINYLQQEYGPEQIAATGKFHYWHKGKLLLEICKWAGLPVGSLTRSLLGVEEKSRTQLPVLDYIAEFAQMPNMETDFTMINKIAECVEDKPRDFVSEAEGIVVAPKRIDDCVPIRRQREQQLPLALMHKTWLDKLRLIQLQFVHNTVINIIKDTLEEASKDEGLVHLPERLEHEEVVFRFLATGKTECIPYLERPSAQALLRRQAPKDIFQLLRIKTQLDERGKKTKPRAEEKQQDKDELSIYRNISECLLAYKCAYLRVKYPVAYTLAILKNYSRNRRKFITLIRGLRNEGKKVIPPHINLSEFDFSYEAQGFRAGLGIIKGIGKKVYTEIAEVRRGGLFNDLIELCRRTDARLVHHRLVENLIKSGALDCFGMKRSEMLALLNKAVMRSHQRSTDTARVTTPDFFDLTLIEVSRNGELELPFCPELTELPKRQLLLYEKQAMGITLSGDIFDVYAE